MKATLGKGNPNEVPKVVVYDTIVAMLPEMSSICVSPITMPCESRKRRRIVLTRLSCPVLFHSVPSHHHTKTCSPQGFCNSKKPQPKRLPPSRCPQRFCPTTHHAHSGRLTRLFPSSPPYRE